MSGSSRSRRGDRVVVYTDGGARPNPGPGGWGVVLVFPGEGADGGEGRRELSGGAAHTTNNRMELTAAIEALAALPAGSRARLHTDSQYLRRGITEWLPAWRARGWRRKDGGAVENADLWRRLAELAAVHDLEWKWVRGHAGDPLNRRADALATAAAARFRRPRAAPEPGSREAGPAAEAEVFLKVSCRGGEGGWAARVRTAGGDEVLSGRASGVTANQLDLEAAATVLESLPVRARVAVYTGSDYLRHGAERWLPGWQRRGWRTKDGGEVKNRAAWERLAAALARRPVSWPEVDEEAKAEIDALEESARPDPG